jgi:hypothetical protein
VYEHADAVEHTRGPTLDVAWRISAVRCGRDLDAVEFLAAFDPVLGAVKIPSSEENYVSVNVRQKELATKIK